MTPPDVRAGPTQRRARRGGRSVLLLLALPAACALPRAGSRAVPVPTAEEDARRAWPTALADAEAAGAAGRFTAADSMLAAFARRWQGTSSGREAVLWRGMLALDPVNPDASTREALAHLDGYREVADTGGAVLRFEYPALMMRRLALQLDSMRAVTAPRRSVPAAPPPPSAGSGPLVAALRDTLRTREAENVALRQVLEQTQQELERVRRRLTAPRP